MNNFIPVNTPILNGNEKKYLNECIDSGWISSEGPFVKKFEDKFSALVNRKYGVAVSNGTGAIDIAISSLNLNPGDEIILPAFTIISCILQIVRMGLKPVLVDCDPITFNMDVHQIESKINTNTKAIFIVHIYGLPVDLDPVLTLVKKYKLFLIEDAAEMHGQTYNNLPCGSFGDISIFSFYPNKHITTGEGGMIVTDNEELAKTCKSLRNLCFDEKERFVHKRLGWNLRMTNLQAAIGIAQLERLDEFIAKKRQMGLLYSKLLGEFDELQLPLLKTNYAENIFWVFSILLNKKINLNAKQAIKILGAKGIGTRPFFCPMHKQPILNEMRIFGNESYPISEYIYEKGFYLPSGLGLTEDNIYSVVDAIKSMLSNLRNSQ